MRNHFHTHPGNPEVKHDDAGNNSYHEHWSSKNDGLAYVYYPHVAKVCKENRDPVSK